MAPRRKKKAQASNRGYATTSIASTKPSTPAASDTPKTEPKSAEPAKDEASSKAGTGEGDHGGDGASAKAAAASASQKGGKNNKKRPQKKAMAVPVSKASGGSWGGKSPMALLLEKLQKSKTERPKITNQEPADSGLYRLQFSVVYQRQEVTVEDIVSHRDRKVACDRTAVYLLHALFGDLAIHRLLPGEYRDLWDELGGQSLDKARAEEEQERLEAERLAAARAFEERRRALPHIHLPEPTRLMVVDTLARHGIKAKQNHGKGGEDTSSIPALPEKLEVLQLARRARALGFSPREVHYAILQSAELETGLTSIHSLVDTLCFQAQDGELPAGFAASTDVEIVRGDQGSAPAQETAEASAVAKFTRYGFPRNTILTAFRTCADASNDVSVLERLVTIHVYNTAGHCDDAKAAAEILMRDWYEALYEERAEAERKEKEEMDALLGDFGGDSDSDGDDGSVGPEMKYQDPFAWTDAMRSRALEELSTARAQELEHLGNALGGAPISTTPPRFADGSPDTWLGIDLKLTHLHRTTTIEVLLRKDSLYPFEPPIILVRNRDVPSYIPLVMTGEANLAAHSMVGPGCFLPAVINWIRDHSGDFAQEPFGLTGAAMQGYLTLELASNTPDRVAVPGARGEGADSNRATTRGPGHGDGEKGSNDAGKDLSPDASKERGGEPGAEGDSKSKRGPSKSKRHTDRTTPGSAGATDRSTTYGPKLDAALSSKMLDKRTGLEPSVQSSGMAAQRASLPAADLEDDIASQIRENQVTVISGETGSGKTTQVPQYILDDYITRQQGSECSIICTQPRRISATSVAERVASERGEKIGGTVGYQIRLESRRSSHTRLLFCTIGVLLRRLASDPMLRNVSHIIIDEVHERATDSDFLLIILKRLLPLRRDLRVILMSATLEPHLFSSYFQKCPIIHIPGRTFPVQQYYLEDALDLVGTDWDSNAYQSELRWKRELIERKRDKTDPEANKPELFRGTVHPIRPDRLTKDIVRDHFGANSPQTRNMLARIDENMINYQLMEALVWKIVEVADRDESPDELTGAILIFMPGLAEIRKLHDALTRGAREYGHKVHVLALHSSLENKEQRKVFRRAPAGYRKVIVSTNIAETSVTIDDVVYVIDAGRLKETQYDVKKGLAVLAETWVSKANARQRAGRAGRVREGICYRMMSRYRFDAWLADQQVPEMHRVPLEQLCLQVKHMELGDIASFLSEAVQPPDSAAIDSAIDMLIAVGALTRTQELTALGRHLATLPVDIRVGKMLLYGAVFRCVDTALTIGAALCSKSPFYSRVGDDRGGEEGGITAFADKSRSDHVALVKAYHGWQDARTQGPRSENDYCDLHCLSKKTLENIRDLKQQFTEVLSDTGFIPKGISIRSLQRTGRDTHTDGVLEATGATLNTNARAQHIVSAVILAGLYPNVVRIVQPEKRYHQTGGGAVLAEPSHKELRFLDDKNEAAFIHPGSVNAKTGLFPNPFLTFLERVRTSRVYIRDCSMVSPNAILMFGGAMVVQHDLQLITIDNWLEMIAPGRIAVLVSRLREQLDLLLLEKMRRPDWDIIDHEVIRAIELVLQG